jgi:hypothetical protein
MKHVLRRNTVQTFSETAGNDFIYSYSRQALDSLLVEFHNLLLHFRFLLESASLQGSENVQIELGKIQAMRRIFRHAPPDLM